MRKIGIGNVSYTPICSSEEMKLEIKIPSANEVVKNMWNKLDDVEKSFINIMIDKNNKQEEEIERLNNEIKRQEDVITNLTDDNEYITDNINSLEVENKKLHSIIKEAREYITKQVHRNQQFYEMDVENILEILDKVEENK